MNVEFCIALSFVVAILVGISIHNNIKLSNIEKKMDWIAEHITKVRKEIDEYHYAVTVKVADVLDTLNEGEYDIELKMEEDDCGCDGCELCEDSCDELDIHLISKEQWMFDNNHYRHYDLKYYPNADRLVYVYNDWDKENEEFEIENVAECVGDGPKFFGVRSSDENVVYIRNNKFNVDFKIEKVVG